MLDMADINELVLQLGHAIPTEPTFGAVEIQRVHGVIDHPIAELPVLEHLRLRLRLTRDAVALAAMLFPQPKRSSSRGHESRSLDRLSRTISI